MPSREVENLTNFKNRKDNASTVIKSYNFKNVFFIRTRGIIIFFILYLFTHCLEVLAKLSLEMDIK